MELYILPSKRETAENPGKFFLLAEKKRNMAGGSQNSDKGAFPIFLEALYLPSPGFLKKRGLSAFLPACNFFADEYAELKWDRIWGKGSRDVPDSDYR
jgi:hypothetical protein